MGNEQGEEGLKKIKRVILSTAEKHGVEIDRIILFGSRARGITEKIVTGTY